jgi:hypothetical protein
MIFARDFEDSWEGGCVSIDAMPDLLCDLFPLVSLASNNTSPLHRAVISILLWTSTDMLVYQDNSDILALRCKAVERRLDGCRVRFRIYHQEVLLRVRRVRHVAYSCKQEASYRVLYLRAQSQSQI